jgi:hypothetical protein
MDDNWSFFMTRYQIYLSETNSALIK